MIASWFFRRQNYLPLHRNVNDIGKQVVSGSVWSGIEVGSTTVLQFVRSILFARILMPADFGALSLATIFTEFILIFANFGFNASIIYQSELDKKDLSTTWWGNFTIDGSVAVICVAFALLSSRFSTDHTTSYIICFLAIQFLILSFASINMALMRRQFMFKQLASARMSNTVVSFLSAWFFVAILNLGVYGLVAGMIIGNVFMTLMFLYFVPWLPSFTFSFAYLRRHLNYGGWFLGVNLITYINGNMDKAIVGTYLNVTQLGFYEYASSIPLMVVNKLSQALNSVLFPAFSSIQRSSEQLGALLLKVYRYNALLIFPILTGIALVAPDFVLAAYGDKWHPVIEPLRFFCLFGMLRIFINPFYPLCNGIGKPQLPFKWIAIYLPINVLLMFVGVKYFGILGAIQVRLLLPMFMTFTMGWEILKIIDVKYMELVKSIKPALVCCFLMSIIVLLVQQFVTAGFETPLPRLFVQIFIGIIVYYVSMFIFFRSDMIFVLDKIRSKKSKI